MRGFNNRTRKNFSTSRILIPLGGLRLPSRLRLIFSDATGERAGTQHLNFFLPQYWPCTVGN
jgi:hypothetical protein